jgi:hypothetical protein
MAEETFSGSFDSASDRNAPSVFAQDDKGGGSVFTAAPNLSVAMPAF